MKSFTRSLLLFVLLASFAFADTSSNSSPTQTVTFSVSGDGTAPFTYQWNKNGTPIAGATSQTHVINSVSVADAGAYTVTVSNKAGSTLSDVATLLVISAPANQKITVVVVSTVK